MEKMNGGRILRGTALAHPLLTAVRRLFQSGDRGQLDKLFRRPSGRFKFLAAAAPD